MKVGVLALQGAFARHRDALAAVGAVSADVRTPAELDDVDALVLPGGESTTISLLLSRAGLLAPLAARLATGMPAFGTCAGLILLAAEVTDGRADQHTFGALDVAVRRNAYGRQRDSFEAMLDVGDPPDRFPGVFIRAPRIERVGPDVEVLATYEGVAVAVAQGAVMGVSFHPELTDDPRLHRAFLERC